MTNIDARPTQAQKDNTMRIATVIPNRRYQVVHSNGMVVLNVRGKRMRRSVVAWLSTHDISALTWQECAAMLRGEFKPTV